MSLTKEIAERENSRTIADYMEFHLFKEGTFLRAYEWSAFLGCRYLHEFKVNKRTFKGIEDPVAYIGFPETSLMKWMPEGAEQRVEDEKHLVVRLTDMLVIDDLDVMIAAYKEWKDAIPLTESQPGLRKRGGGKAVDSDGPDGNCPTTLTTIMQRILAFPIESKSPIESMTFLAEVKQRLALLI